MDCASSLLDRAPKIFKSIILSHLGTIIRKAQQCVAILNRSEPTGIGYDLLSGYETVMKSDKPAAINTEDIRQNREDLKTAVVDLIDAGCFDMNPVVAIHPEKNCEFPQSC